MAWYGTRVLTYFATILCKIRILNTSLVAGLWASEMFLVALKTLLK